MAFEMSEIYQHVFFAENSAPQALKAQSFTYFACMALVEGHRPNGVNSAGRSHGAHGAGLVRRAALHGICHFRGDDTAAAGNCPWCGGRETERRGDRRDRGCA